MPSPDSAGGPVPSGGAPLRVVFAGTPAFAERALGRLLASRHPVVAVLTQPDRPAGRGQRLSPSPVKARATAAGLPVPQGFVLSTGFCGECDGANGRVPPNLREVLADGIRHVERESGLAFGGRRKPLLVSVRSGAPVSMPGMMETLLNVGLCEATLPGLLRQSGNPRMVWDAYRRLIASYAQLVAGLPAPLVLLGCVALGIAAYTLAVTLLARGTLLRLLASAVPGFGGRLAARADAGR